MRNLVGAPQLLAVIPGGPILQLTNRQMLVDIRSGNPRRYVGKFSDYVSINWQVITGEQLKQLLESMPPKGPGAAQDEQGS